MGGAAILRCRCSVRERSPAFLSVHRARRRPPVAALSAPAKRHEIHCRRRGVRERSSAFLRPAHGPCGVPSVRHYWRMRTPSEVGGTVSASVWTQKRPANAHERTPSDNRPLQPCNRLTGLHTSPPDPSPSIRLKAPDNTTNAALHASRDRSPTAPWGTVRRVRGSLTFDVRG